MLGKIILIAAETLADYLTEFNAGGMVSVRYEIKRVGRDSVRKD